MDSKITEALNHQLNYELYSAYVYVGMEAYFDNASLKGFANWMHIQAHEELMHAKKFYDYLIHSGEKITLGAIKAPEVGWKSPLAVFEAAYQHELTVTKRIHQLVKLAQDNNDYPTESFLQWFIDEQVEELTSLREIIDRLKLIANDTSALFILDKELSLRALDASSGT